MLNSPNEKIFEKTQVIDNQFDFEGIGFNTCWVAQL